mmetsp:Transcript_64166/g.106668  ORF Transcript_64166/g.106668 Transcript_64166/m.106668 type:complete len:216 (+) Transcript_64166:341-988(+)
MDTIAGIPSAAEDRPMAFPLSLRTTSLTRTPALCAGESARTATTLLVVPSSKAMPSDSPASGLSTNVTVFWPNPSGRGGRSSATVRLFVSLSASHLTAPSLPPLLPSELELLLEVRGDRMRSLAASLRRLIRMVEAAVLSPSPSPAPSAPLPSEVHSEVDELLCDLLINPLTLSTTVSLRRLIRLEDMIFALLSKPLVLPLLFGHVCTKVGSNST